MKNSVSNFRSAHLLLKTSCALLLSFFMAGGLTAQSLSKEEMIKKIQSTPKEEIANYYRTVHSRVPDPERTKALQQKAIMSEVPGTKASNALQMPEKMWFPGEFEEVQAIYLTFPYYAMFRDGSGYAYPEFDHIGMNSAGTKLGYIDYYIDTFSVQSRMPIIFAELINGIQQYAEAWINLWEIDDSTALKDFMQRNGMPLTNYRFFSAPGNSIWYRDCGPVAFYHGDNDDIAFLDFEYYPGRAMDDILPIALGQATGYPVYTTSIEFEGGNILVDGAQTLFTSDAVYGPNNDIYGQAYLRNGVVNISAYSYRAKTPLNRNQVNDSLTHLMNLSRLEVLPALKYDGGTGHIDLYADMWDEEHFVFTQYPQELSNFVDYPIVARNVDSITSLYSVHSRRYLKEYIPLPKKDNNTWYTSNADYENYTRTYSNHTIVNDGIIQPIFSNSTWGATAWDNAALDSMRAKYPGYTFVPIDVRGEQNNPYDYGFDGSGGAIHCITKQIPAENPIRILHQVPAKAGASYPIKATITNRSGIASAKCFWRVKGETAWNNTSLTAGANNIFSADIQTNASPANDTLEYYISATSNNGKTITKPLTAPRGFYTTYTDFAYGLSINGFDMENAFGQFYPNPTTGTTRIEIQNPDRQNMDVKVLNVVGKIVYETSLQNVDEHAIFEMNTNSFAKGWYAVVFSAGNGERVIRKLIVQ